jgi:hypothetical protein
MQTNYNYPAAAIAGMLANIGEKRVDSYVQAEASAEIAFGLGVAFSAAQDAGTPAQALKLAASTDKIAGIVVHSHAYDVRTELGTVGVKPKAMLGVLQEGDVWVNVEEAVTPTSEVWVRHTANGAGKLNPGEFRTDIDTDKAIRWYGAQFQTSTTGAGLALLRINMSAHRAH